MSKLFGVFSLYRSEISWYYNNSGTNQRYSQINQKGYKSLDEGDSVEFDLVHTSRGDQAHNVSRINVMKH